jgi:hypothetical protein
MYIDFKQLASKCEEFNEMDGTGNVTETLNQFVQYLLLTPQSDFEDETLDDEELSLKTVIVKNSLIRDSILVIGQPVIETKPAPKTKGTLKKQN